MLSRRGGKGVPLVIIISSGFREIGKDGTELEHRLVSIADQHGIRIMGPNCLGRMMPNQGINTTFNQVSPKPGKITFISQSGAGITTIVDLNLPEAMGFSAVISVGNQADRTFEDFIDLAAWDPHKIAIILYIEQIQDGRRFMENVGPVTMEKPVGAIKAGSSRIGRLETASHTSSLAGSYDVYMTAFRQCGMIPVKSIHEVFTRFSRPPNSCHRQATLGGCARS